MKEIWSRLLGRWLSLPLLVVCVAGLAPAARAQDGGGSIDLVVSALALVGVPYRPGGSDPATGLDCSGMVRYAAWIALGMQLPRRAEDIGRSGVAVQRSELQPGDLVFFNTRGRPYSHVGIYLGDDRFVHAPALRGQVRIEQMSQTYWRKRFEGARRLGPREQESVVAVVSAPFGNPVTVMEHGDWGRVTP